MTWPPRWQQPARSAGFIVNPVAPDAIRLAPPLVVTADQLDTFVAALPALLDGLDSSRDAVLDTPEETR